MRTQAQLLSIITERLTEAGVTYMLVGSLASSFHGEPRQTRDIDIVVEADAEHLQRFRDSLDPNEFYTDAGAMREALERRTSFNIIDITGGWKVDLLVRRDRQFSVTELSRRIAVRILGTSTFVASPEDTVIAKLEWASQGDSERQFRDVIGILEAQGASIDRAYLDHWIIALDLGHAWQAVAESAQETDRGARTRPN